VAKEVANWTSTLEGWVVQIATTTAQLLNLPGYSGGGWTEMIFPNPVMDTPLLGDDWPGMLFTNYLRLVFAWGGFPGLSRRPEDAAAATEEVAFLTNDLLPL
jgi:hypothetical protein